MYEPNQDSRPDRPSPDIDHRSGRRRPVLHFWRCFWLSFLVISLTYAAHSFYVPPNKIAWAGDYEVAQMQAIESDKPMILYFTGEWCVPCRIMKRQVWADQEVTNRVNDQFIPVAIEVSDPKNSALLERYNVKGSPVTIMTDPNGNARTWRSGRTGKADFLEFLKEANQTPIQE